MSAPKTACGCQEAKDPYQESLQVVWHDPLRYDAQVHGPDYFPKKGKVASVEDNKAQGREALGSLLALLKAAAKMHQTHHWQTLGPTFYSDHLLFDRLYTESLPLIDQVAERGVGLYGPSTVSSSLQAYKEHEYIRGLASDSHDPVVMVADSLKVERLIQTMVSVVLETLKASGELTNGTDNLLQGVADAHESFIYLLQQRSPQEVYDYSR